MRATRRFAVAILGLAAAAALAAAALWFWAWYEPERTLEPLWDAVVTTAAAAHRFDDPFGIAAAPDGALYVAGGHRIHRIGADGRVVRIAGSTRGFQDGPVDTSRFSTPSGLALHTDGTLFVADTGNNAVRRITADGLVSTIADHGSGLNGPIGIAVDPQGRIIVADTYNDRVIALDASGALTAVAGTGQAGFADGPAEQAQFDTPTGVALDRDGNIYVADAGNGAVRVISTAGVVGTIAPGYGDAPMRPIGVAAGAEGSIFATDDRGRIVEITPNAGQRTLAGGRPGFQDGPGGSARFRAPSGIALLGRARLAVTDRRNGLVRLVEARSLMDLRPPAPPVKPHFDAATFGLRPLLWPFMPLDGPFEITGTLGEPRGGEGSERFHAGLDIHSPEGTLVRAVRHAVAEDPLATFDFGTLNESVRIGPITYIHLRVARDHRDLPIPDDRFAIRTDDAGKVTRVRLKRGAIFDSGDVIGTVNRFYHAHLNVGWPGEELNPLAFRLTNFEDTIPPVIARGGITVIGEDGLPLVRRERKRVVVQGRVRVVVDAWDQVNGNQARRRLGLYRLGYQVLNADGTPVDGFEAVRETLVFDRQPRDPAAARVVYAAGSGIPVYGNRRTRFLYVVTSTLRDGVAADGALDTTALPPGDYTLRVLAADIRGNEALANRDLAITVLAPLLGSAGHGPTGGE